ncbi:MAG: isoprenylcysteine carboxylmethyltransferase family protein [Sphingomonas sp.]
MTFPLPQPLFLLILALSFFYFFIAGAGTFRRQSGDDVGAGVAQLSLLVSGGVLPWMLGHRVPIALANGIVALALLAASLLLYEWSRRTLSRVGPSIAWSGEVSDAVCDTGPYARIRHPIYTSYMLAFAAVAIALPMIATAAILLINAALYLHAALDDERSLARSVLSDDYARYRARTGMFFPRL